MPVAAIEIDFLPVGSETKSGDAICIRYGTPEAWELMIVDGGDLAAGDDLVAHVTKYYGAGVTISHVVCTHSDQDHVSGLRRVLEAFPVSNVWVHQPWLHAAELNPYFKGAWTDANLASHLRNECFSIVATLCDQAESLGIPLREPLARQVIGPFTVLAPSGYRLLELYPQMDQTPAQKFETGLTSLVRRAKAAVYGIFETWTNETLQDPGPNGTSVPNQTSVVLYSSAVGGVLLTGDAGVGALADAVAVSEAIGTVLYRPKLVQIPHHGSRHNVSPAVLDRILGTVVAEGAVPDCSAYSSAAIKSEMPRRQVENAFRRRGYSTQTTKGVILTWNIGFPQRPGWTYGLESRPFHSHVEA